MRTLQELGEAVATKRRVLRLKQKDVAAQAGITPESLLRFERGQATEFGTRKLLAVLAVLGMELTLSLIHIFIHSSSAVAAIVVTINRGGQLLSLIHI